MRLRDDFEKLYVKTSKNIGERKILSFFPRICITLLKNIEIQMPIQKLSYDSRLCLKLENNPW